MKLKKTQGSQPPEILRNKLFCFRFEANEFEQNQG